MKIPEELRTLAVHLEGKRSVSEALAEDCANNGEHANATRHRKRAASAAHYASVCMAAADALAEKKARKKAATVAVSDEPEFQALSQLFRRGERAVWSPSELAKYQDLKSAGLLSPENLATVSAYHMDQVRKGDDGRHRRDLATFLNNFTGELDRARAMGQPKGAESPAEPEGWADFLASRHADYKGTYRHAPGFMKNDFEAWRK